MKVFYHVEVRCETILLRDGLKILAPVSERKREKKTFCIEGVKKTCIGVTFEMASIGGGVGVEDTVVIPKAGIVFVSCPMVKSAQTCLIFYQKMG